MGRVVIEWYKSAGIGCADGLAAREPFRKPFMGNLVCKFGKLHGCG